MDIFRNQDPTLDLINESPAERKARADLLRTVKLAIGGLAVIAVATLGSKILSNGLDVPDNYHDLSREQIKESFEQNQRLDPSARQEPKIGTALKLELTKDGRVLVYEDGNLINKDD